MKIAFIGDIHLGKALAHTTTASADRFNTLRQEVLAKCFDHGADIIIQVGDMLDSATCNSTTFVEMLALMQKTNFTLTGNHDYSRDKTKLPAIVEAGNYIEEHYYDGKPHQLIQEFARMVDDSVVLDFVAYHSSQELFEAKLNSLAPPIDKRKRFLILHCNLLCKFEVNEIVNNLTDDMITSLLERYDYIITGHEHNARELYDGRVIATGSVVPMSFGQMTDKYVWIYDTELAVLTPYVVWYATTFEQLTVDEFLSYSDFQVFTEVIGEIRPEQVLPVNRKITQLFRDGECIAIKNSSVFQGIDEKVTAQNFKMLSWREMIKSKIPEKLSRLYSELESSVCDQ